MIHVNWATNFRDHHFEDNLENKTQRHFDVAVRNIRHNEPRENGSGAKKVGL